MADSEAKQPGDLLDALGRVFGFRAFRPNQEETVRAVLAGRDVFAVMPTGGGKSLCYQLPAHLLAGTCVVISPLISLMKDQVDAAGATGLRAEFYNSSLDGLQRSEVLRRLAGGELDLLYVAPERFAMDGFLARLTAARVCLFAIDEAHCISEWGHDFRPDYLALSRLVGQFGDIPVAAFTATATRHVQEDIIERLKLREPHVVRASFNRPNLFYQVVPKDDVSRQVLSFVRERPGEAGIVYRTTRGNVEATAAYLAGRGVKALPYHAGLDGETRKANQDAFNRDEVDVIVATIAFGMGIDKSNVRFVLHGDLPKNIEGYYQETGRAGRDGEPAHCRLFLSRGDIPKIRYFIDQIEDDRERAVAAAKLREMVHYATVNVCRRRQLLGYFGEELPGENCGACDVCAGRVERVEATTEARMVLSAIVRTAQRFGAGHVVDVVTGADTQKIRDFGHDRVKTYGVGRGKPKRIWRGVIDNLVAQECLRVDDGRFPILKIAPKGYDVLFGKQPFYVLKPREPASPRRERRRRPAPADEPADYDEALFEELRAVRRRLASRQGVPPYIIFSDRTLREMAAECPTTPAAMHDITGVGERKLERYGEAFLDAIRPFAARQSQGSPPDSVLREPSAPEPPPPAGRKGRSLEATWQLVGEGLSLVEIAARRKLTPATVAGHVEKLIRSGRDVDPDALIGPGKRIEIERLFATLGTQSLRKVVEASGGSVGYAQARVVRAYLDRRDGVG